MALGRQGELMVGWAELPRSPGHVFYDRLQAVLVAAGFDRFAETRCAPYYASRQGRPSLPPGRYFRMHLVGYFEGTPGFNPGAGERGLEWRCADSLSLREFLRLGTTEPVPDHSWLSKTRARRPLEVHEAVFAWVLQRLAEHGLIRGGRIGVDASTMAADAALRTIVRRDTGETYRKMLARMARASGIGTPTAEDLIRLDRQRKGKRLSNRDWTSPSDPEARIAKLKDGRTHLAYQPEHAVDLAPGAIVAATVQPADRGDSATLPGTLKAAEANLAAPGAAPTPEAPAKLVADMGYHSRDGLKALEGGAWKSRIAGKKASGVHRWRGDDEARRAVSNNRARLRSGVAKAAFKLRAELCERGFALVLDRGGLRRAWLRGCENLHKRDLVHVAGYNLGLLMRRLVGAGTPKEFLARAPARLLALAPADGLVRVILSVTTGTEAAMLAVSLEPEPGGQSPGLSTRCYKTFFCVDHPRAGLGGRFTFAHPMGQPDVESLKYPEAAVAYEEAFCSVRWARSGSATPRSSPRMRIGTCSRARSFRGSENATGAPPGASAPRGAPRAGIRWWAPHAAGRHRAATPGGMRRRPSPLARAPTTGWR
jgi:hypothetical protein